MEHNAMLQLENVSLSYGKIAALKDISLSLKQGEIVAIIGANGAGKSTLINAISGVVAAQKGTITFQNKIINKLPAWKIVRQGIIQIPEGRKVFPKMTVLENLELGAYPENKNRIVKELIEQQYIKFPVLRERRDQPAGTLSGGEQQMLAIARGLMASPSLLMFDEPSMGLSPVMVEKVFQIIQEINKQGITILLVEQNAKKTLQIATRAYLFETGKIILSGTGTNLLENDLVKRTYLGIS